MEFSDDEVTTDEHDRAIGDEDRLRKCSIS